MNYDRVALSIAINVQLNDFTKLYIILTLPLLSSFMLNRIKRFHYKHALAGNPYPRGQGICNLGRPVLGHHFYRVRLPDLC